MNTYIELNAQLSDDPKFEKPLNRKIAPFEHGQAAIDWLEKMGFKKQAHGDLWEHSLRDFCVVGEPTVRRNNTKPFTARICLSDNIDPKKVYFA